MDSSIFLTVHFNFSSHQTASESDDSSLNSTEDGGHVMLSRRAGPMPSPSPMQYAASPMLRSEYYGEMPQQLQQFHNVISGSVTTVPIEGQSSSAIQVTIEFPVHVEYLCRELQSVLLNF